MLISGLHSAAVVLRSGEVRRKHGDGIAKVVMRG